MNKATATPQEKFLNNLVKMITAFDAINVIYADLIQTKDIYVADHWVKAMTKNAFYIKAMTNTLSDNNCADRINLISPPISSLHECMVDFETLSEREEFDMWIAIEMALRKICDLYDEIFDNNELNPYMVEFYKFYIHNHVRSIKTLSRRVYCSMP